MVDIATALAQLVQGKTPLLLEAKEEVPAPAHARREPVAARAAPARGGARAAAAARPAGDVGLETYRIEVGHQHGVQPGNIVGAIANEADREARSAEQTSEPQSLMSISTTAF